MIAAYVPNLLDRSRFGGQVRFIDGPAALADGEVSLVVVDLDRCQPDQFTAYAAANAPAVGFGPHVDSERHRRAMEAGFTEVLARSVFFKRLPRLLDEARRGPGRE